MITGNYVNGVERDRPYVEPRIRVRAPDRDYSHVEPPQWPVLEPEALQGFAGEIVNASTANSEADPAAVLATFLTHAGICVGRGPRIRVGDDFHHARLYVAIVGQSARGRKGTSEKPIRRIGQCATELIGDTLNWQPGPLSTGEGLAYAIRDSDGLKEGDPGIEDKRLLIVEGEFAAPLRAMQRNGNTLSTALRSGWDGLTIAPMTKSNRITASNPHVGIVGHITKQELGELLSSVDIFNGFANRFLWWCARRSKSLPLAPGMDQQVVDRLAAEYARRLRAAKQIGEVEFSDEARDLYVALYDAITEEKYGMHAVVTSRGEAQVIRLALTYALIDASPIITTAHLTSAIAVWNYCDSSAAYLFGHSGPDPLEKRVVDALARRPLVTTELHHALGNHTRGESLRSALESLEARGQLERVTTPTGGRPSVMWRLRPHFKSANEAKKAN